MICLKDECINTLNDKNIFKSKHKTLGLKTLYVWVNLDAKFFEDTET